MDGTRDLQGASGPDPASAILERLDSIGRLLAHGVAPPPALHRPAGADAHLVTRIDMLGRIVEQALADREETDARLAALARRLVDLEGRLAPALETCAERLAEAVPLLAEAALDSLPGGGVALRTALRELRDAVAALDRRIGLPGGAPPLRLPAAMPPPPPPRWPDAMATMNRSAQPEATAGEAAPSPPGEPNAGDGPLLLVGPLRPANRTAPELDAAPDGATIPGAASDADLGSQGVLHRLLALSRQDGGPSGPGPTTSADGDPARLPP